MCWLFPLQAAWNKPDNGNPLLPGYTADPSILYDSAWGVFYIYSTTDGVWINYGSDPQVACSSDFVHWKFRPLTLPSFWPSAKLGVPSAMRHPTNGKSACGNVTSRYMFRGRLLAANSALSLFLTFHGLSAKQ
ncbi:MAG: hypothetical protein JW913_04710 [Chitinispirillaceae bacterium]|nr:hypothetical protein [Chitinispirillaceae bacterium]